jgi:plastocyanin
MLHARADDAPATPAPTDALLRRVTRRRYARATATVAGCAAAVAALVGVAAGLADPAPRAVAPATQPPTPPTGDRYEFCTGLPADEIVVAVHATELKFAQGCYRVGAGAGAVTFTNPQRVAHDLVIAPDGDPAHPVFRSEPIVATAGTTASVHADLVAPFAAGDYALTCSIHPEMHAQLVIR